ncbi:hypothetical protein L484_007768 [Morus notabilis]|uniref:Uncharacterized protein n=1 Tax=Morus notabilis TaxID=981085 RepID=W9RKD4_9ROSA|nr:hypothetical protein L484_007768 [Morus notabilis]
MSSLQIWSYDIVNYGQISGKEPFLPHFVVGVDVVVDDDDDVVVVVIIGVVDFVMITRLKVGEWLTGCFQQIYRQLNEANITVPPLPSAFRPPSPPPADDEDDDAQI